MDKITVGAATENTILCLIDFSGESRQALRWATGMASLLHARLTVLYTYRLLQSKSEALQMKKQKEVEALEKFLQLKSELPSDNQVQYDFRTEIGFLTDRVDAYVSDHQVSMLVIHKSMIKANNESVRHIVENLTVPFVIIP